MAKKAKKLKGAAAMSKAAKDAKQKSISPASSEISYTSSEEEHVTKINVTGHPKRARKLTGAAQKSYTTKRPKTNDSTNAQLEIYDNKSSIDNTVNISVQSSSPALQQTAAAEIIPIRGIAIQCYLIDQDVSYLEANPEHLMDEGSLYAYMASMAHRSALRVAVVSPHYTYNLGAISALQNVFGDFDNYEVLIIPCYFPGHHAISIYERGSGIVRFFDPLPTIDRMTEPYKRCLQQAVVQLQGEMHTDSVEIATERDTYNIQTDSINCGFHSCLIVESYLFNRKITFLEGLNIQNERSRILRHLRQLLISDDGFEYVPRPIHLQRETEKVIEQETDEETMKAPAPLIRRSTRLAAKKNHPAVTISSLPPIMKQKKAECKRKHPKLGCAAVSANHFPDYVDSGTLNKHKRCPHCRALLFLSETSSICCANGKVSLAERQDPPPFIKAHLNPNVDVGSARDFLKNIRIYNNMLAFGFVQVDSTTPPGRGPPVCLLNGEFRHCISDLSFDAQRPPTFGNLYILSVAEAEAERKKNPFSEAIRMNVLKALDVELRTTHPLARIWMHAYEQYQLKKIAAETAGTAIPQFRLILLNEWDTPANLRDNNLHPRQVNLPIDDAMYAIWCSDTEAVPARKGIWLQPRHGQLSQIRHMNLYHPMTDSACYPLLFPFGEEGFHWGIRTASAISGESKSITKRLENVELRDRPAELENENYNVNDDDRNSIASDTSSVSDLFEQSEEEGQETTGAPKRREFVSIAQFYRYHYAIRNNINNPPLCLRMGMLTQQHVIDTSFKIEQQVAQHVRRVQRDLRQTLPEALLQYLSRNLQANEELGRVVFSTKNMKGSIAYMREKFYNTTAMFQRVQKPQFFITFTFNPRWLEVARNIGPTGRLQTPADRVDISCRIWIDKARKIHHDIERDGIFGEMKAYAESLEFQKRGGPHFHMLLATDAEKTSEIIDEYICAEIPKLPEEDDDSPQADQHRLYHELVVTHMLHNCTNTSPCMVNGKCSKGFPKPFSNHTILFDDKPALYRRRSPADGGQTYSKRIGTGNRAATIVYNNSHVVPHNKYLLMKYHTHINIESLYGRQGMKYALKYSFKSSSWAYVRLDERQSKEQGGRRIVHYDELVRYFKCCYRSPHEAWMRMNQYPFVRMSHTVHKIPIHQPDQRPIYFVPGEEQLAADAYQRGGLKDTQLLAWMKKNREDPAARAYTILEFVQWYRFDTRSGTWHKRKRTGKNRLTISRLQFVPPRNVELFALKQILMHVKGAHCWTDLRTVEGIEHSTFTEAAMAMGLMEDEVVWHRTLAEGAKTSNPQQMRSLFVQILLFGNPPSPVDLWNEFVDEFYYHKNCRPHEKAGRIDKALQLINAMLGYHGKNCADFGLPMPSRRANVDIDEDLNEFFFPRQDPDDGPDATANVARNSDDYYSRLNVEQKSIIDAVEEALRTAASDVKTSRLFFLTGSGGTGKTYVYNTLIFRCVSKGIKVMVTATTGIAACLLFNGTTVHRAFGTGIRIDPKKLPSHTAESMTARCIRHADLIIVDEVSMMHRDLLEVVDGLLKMFAPPQMKTIGFGGKVILLGADWKQMLPIVRDGNNLGPVAACIQSRPDYAQFRNVKLLRNMRVTAGQEEFSDFLHKLGTGSNMIENTDRVSVPPQMLVSSLEELIRFVFEDGAVFERPEALHDRFLMAPMNAQVDALNELILNAFPGEVREYLSGDVAFSDNPLDVHAAENDPESLNEFRTGNLPDHRLRLKKNAVVMLMCNVDVSRALCNGTRMTVESLGNDVIYCKTIAASSFRTGQVVALSRFKFRYDGTRPDGSGPRFTRLQFPVRVAFAVTVNKAQGQTASRIGLSLEREVFAPGQLYVALSRVKTADSVKVFNPHGRTALKNDVKNVVAAGIRF